MFATAADDVRVWSSASLGMCYKFGIGSSSKVASVSWSADGKQLASVLRGHDQIHLTAFLASQPYHTKSCVSGVLCSCCQVSHRNSRYLCVGSVDGAVILWDVKNGKTVHSYQGHKEVVTQVVFNDDDSFVVSGAFDGSVALHTVDTKRTRVLCEPTGKAVTGLQCSVHNRFRFVSASTDGYVSAWDGSARRLLKRHLLHPLRGASGVALSPQNQFLAASVGLDGQLVFYDLDAGSMQAKLQTPASSLESVCFLPDGQRVVVGATSGQLYIYDLRAARAEPPVTLGDPHGTPVTAIAVCSTVPQPVQVMVSMSTAGAAASTAMPRPQSGGTDASARLSAGSGWSVNGSPDGLSTGDVGYSRGSLDGLLINRDRPMDVASNLLDASWMSGCSTSTDRRSIRLSDIIPMLPESPPGLTKPSCLPRPMSLTPEQGEVQAAEAKRASDSVRTPGSVFGPSPQATPRADGDAPAARQNGHVAGSVNGTPESSPDGDGAASQGHSLLGGGRSSAGSTPDFTPSQEAVVRQIVESAIDPWAYRLDSHVRHVHLQLTMMQQAFRRDNQAMLQQVFDEVQALRSDIEKMRLSS